MKSSLTRSALLLALVCACVSISSCQSSGSKQEQLTTLAGYANTAITLAELGGVVNAKQADLARRSGKLLLDASATEGNDAKLALISKTVVDYAEETGKLTPEQIAALREAGTVNLVPPATPLPPLSSSPPPALP